MSIAKGNLTLPIVNLDHSERNFVFFLAGFRNDLTSSVFMQSFWKGRCRLKCVLRRDFALVISLDCISPAASCGLSEGRCSTDFSLVSLYSLPFPSCKLLLPNILWFFVFPFEPYPYRIVFVVFAPDILASVWFSK